MLSDDIGVLSGFRVYHSEFLAHIKTFKTMIVK